MARIDKYDPKVGGFRARLAGSWAGSETPIGVGEDANGHIVAGAGQSGIVGILCKADPASALDVVDVMTDGELVEWLVLGTPGVAGTIYCADTTTGAITATAPSATKVKVGWTVETDRLIVRCARGSGGTGSGTVVTGGQAAIAQIATADATDLASSEALANATKAKVNTLLTELHNSGILA